MFKFDRKRMKGKIVLYKYIELFNLLFQLTIFIIFSISVSYQDLLNTFFFIRNIKYLFQTLLKFQLGHLIPCNIFYHLN